MTVSTTAQALETLLAKLYTDRAARDAFLADPESYARAVRSFRTPLYWRAPWAFLRS